VGGGGSETNDEKRYAFLSGPCGRGRLVPHSVDQSGPCGRGRIGRQVRVPQGLAESSPRGRRRIGNDACGAEDRYYTLNENETIRVRRRKLCPNKAQYKLLADTLETQRRLWNRAVEIREKTYSDYLDALRLQETRPETVLPAKSISKGDLKKLLVTQGRKDDPFLAASPRRVNCATIDRLDNAYQTYFTQLKNPALSPRKPGLKGRHEYNTIGFDAFEGSRLESKNRVWLTGLGSFKFFDERDDLSGLDIRSVTLTRTSMPAGKRGHPGYECDWYIAFGVVVAVTERPALPTVTVTVAPSGTAITSEGHPVELPQHLARQSGRIGQKQKAQSTLRGPRRGKRPSCRWKLLSRQIKSHHASAASARNIDHHALAKRLLAEHSEVLVETPDMYRAIQRPAARPDAEGDKGTFRPNGRERTKSKRKRYYDSAWSKFRDIAAEKAALFRETSHHH